MPAAEIERRPEFARLVAAHRIGWCSAAFAGFAFVTMLCGWHAADDGLPANYLAGFLVALAVGMFGQLWALRGTRAALRSLHDDFDEADLRAADRLATRIGALGERAGRQYDGWPFRQS